MLKYFIKVPRIVCWVGLLSVGFSDRVASSGSHFLFGINESGGENAYAQNPGVYGSDYYYPQQVDINAPQAAGFKIIRLPFLINRLQHRNNGPLDPTELRRIQAIVMMANSAGLKVILDPHQAGNMLNTTDGNWYPVGSANMPNSTFAKFWHYTAAAFKNNANVWFDLMNEPSSQTATAWAISARAAINAIRATGARNMILIPGTDWEAANRWVSDPVGAPFAFTMHQYLDYESGDTGSDNGCYSGFGGAALIAATNWLAANDYSGFLGEFNWYNTGTAANVDSQANGDCHAKGMAMPQALNNPAWIGAAWWTSGPWVGNNAVNVEPGSNGYFGERAQLYDLAQFGIAASPTYFYVNPPAQGAIRGTPYIVGNVGTGRTAVTAYLGTNALATVAPVGSASIRAFNLSINTTSIPDGAVPIRIVASNPAAGITCEEIDVTLNVAN